MIIKIKVKPNSSENLIIKTNEGLIVKVKEKPENNKANIGIIKLLGKHYKVPASNIKIKSGMSSTKKTVEVKV